MNYYCKPIFDNIWMGVAGDFDSLLNLLELIIINDYDYEGQEIFLEAVNVLIKSYGTYIFIHERDEIKQRVNLLKHLELLCWKEKDLDTICRVRQTLMGKILLFE